MSRLKTLLMMLFLLFCATVGFSQDEFDGIKEPPEGSIFVRDFKGMPEDFSEEFPIFSNKVSYQKVFNMPDFSSGKRGATNRVFGFAHWCPTGKFEKVYKWYSRKTKQLGYKETFKSENLIDEFIEVLLEKVEDNKIKVVKITIKKERVDVLIHKERELPKKKIKTRVRRGKMEKQSITPVKKENDGTLMDTEKENN